MISTEQLQESVEEHLRDLRRLEVHELLHQHQLLEPIVQRLAQEQMAEDASFTTEEEEKLFKQAWKGVEGVTPQNNHSEWPENISDEAKKLVSSQLQRLKLQKRLNELYEGEVEPYFLSRRSDLERVTYRAIRVDQLGLAEELYLKLLEKEETFERLAAIHSKGEERLAGGLMGPMYIVDPHPNISKVLRHLAPGEVSRPIQIDKWFVVLRMEQREPASLSHSTRLQLQHELLERQIKPIIQEIIEGLNITLQNQEGTVEGQS